MSARVSLLLRRGTSIFRCRADSGWPPSKLVRNALRLRLALFLVASLLGGSLPSGAQSSKETRDATSPETNKPKQRVDVSVELRWRNEFRDNADFSTGDDFDHFLGQRVRINLRINAHENLSFFVQGQDVWLYGAERDKIIHNTATNLHQIYLDWKPAGSEQWELRAGRQELIYGKQRLLGAFGWDNVSRTFDAGRLRYRRSVWTGDFFWARLVDIRRRGAGHRPGNRDLYGVYFTRSPKGSSGRTELYGFMLRDGLRVSGERGTAPRLTRIFTLGVRRHYQPVTGFRYEIENAWQLGKRGPDTHHAVAAVANAGYAWGGDHRPSLAFEYAFASGDDNPADGDSTEFNNLFPTNHIHYGYADLVGLRNLHDFRLTGAAQVRPKVRVEVDYHRFLLAAKRGPWKSAGGAVLGWDPTGSSGRDIGQELDFTVRLPLMKRLGFLAGYSVFLPGAFAERTRGPQTHHFGYIQTTVRF